MPPLWRNATAEILEIGLLRYSTQLSNSFFRLGNCMRRDLGPQKTSQGPIVRSSHFRMEIWNGNYGYIGASWGQKRKLNDEATVVSVDDT